MLKLSVIGGQLSVLWSGGRSRPPVRREILGGRERPPLHRSASPQAREKSCN
jgi:hypothetical protein